MLTFRHASGGRKAMHQDGLPTRVIIRAMNEFLIEAVQAALRPHDGDVIATVVFSTVVASNLHPIVHCRPDARRLFEHYEGLSDNDLRPVSVNSVAKSFGIPYETARGAATRLVQRGRCRKSTKGLIAPIEVLRSPGITQAAYATTAALREAIRRMHDIGFDFDAIACAGRAAVGPEAELGDPPPRLISWIAADFLIRGVEGLISTFGDFTNAFLFCGVMSENAKGFMDDYSQAWRYAGMDTPPPDALRRPVSVRALAERLELPFETVRRHANRLVRSGDLARREEGLIAPTSVMQSPRIIGQSPLIAAQFARMIAELKRAGYVFPHSDRAETASA